MVFQGNPSPDRDPNTYRLVQSHPENLHTDTVSLFDLHEDMQTVDTISLTDLREDKLKEKVNHSARLSEGNPNTDYGAPR